jgi:hypothetical protein
MMIQKNVFGGPGNLQQSMMLMIQGWLQGQKEQEEKKESDLLAEILGKQQPEEAAPEDFYRQQTEELLASPLRPQSKAQGLQMLAGKRNLTTPEAAKDIKRIKLDFWDPQGKKRSMMVPEAAYSAVADKIVEGGGVLSEPKEEKWETKQAVLNGKPVFAQISDRGNTRVLNGNFEPIAQGLKFTIDKDGNMTFAQGAGAAMTAPDNIPISKPARTEFEKDIAKLNEQSARLRQIADSFDPEALTLGGKIDADWLNLKDRLTGIGGFEGLSQEEKSTLDRYSKFGQDAVRNANRTINELTGAAMSEWEAKRIMLEIPEFNPGWFKGDGPTKFKTKLDNASKSVDMAIARKKYYLKKGIPDSEQKERQEGNERSGSPFADFKRDINRRGAEVAVEYKKANPNAKDDEIRRAVSKKIKEEFGL